LSKTTPQAVLSMHVSPPPPKRRAPNLVEAIDHALRLAPRLAASVNGRHAGGVLDGR